jgi:class 3 adenylate cyclase
MERQLVDQLVAGKDLRSLDAKVEDITVFFSDIKGFSTVSEKFRDDPKGLMRFLNRYLTAVTPALRRHGACIDKYIGDAVVALFGAPIRTPTHPLQACKGALEMQQVLARLREEFAKEGLPDNIYTRIGINTDTLLVGNIGSDELLDYTAIGDGMNLAARLEAANKAFGTSILVGPETARRVAGKIEVRELDSVRVAGKQQVIPVFEVMALAGQLTPQQERLRALYAEALEQWRQRKPAEATRLLDAALQLVPDDGPSLALRARSDSAQWERSPSSTRFATWESRRMLNRRWLGIAVFVVAAGVAAIALFESTRLTPERPRLRLPDCRHGLAIAPPKLGLLEVGRSVSRGRRHAHARPGVRHRKRRRCAQRARRRGRGHHAFTTFAGQRTTTTDSSGRFELRGLTEGTVHLSLVRADGYLELTPSAELHLVDGVCVSSLTLTLSPRVEYVGDVVDAPKVRPSSERTSSSPPSARPSSSHSSPMREASSTSSRPKEPSSPRPTPGSSRVAQRSTSRCAPHARSCCGSRDCRPMQGTPRRRFAAWCSMSATLASRRSSSSGASSVRRARRRTPWRRRQMAPSRSPRRRGVFLLLARHGD